MEDFNKEQAFNEIMELYKGKENAGFFEHMRIIEKGMDKVEQIYLDGYKKGLEAGLKQIDINDTN